MEFSLLWAALTAVAAGYLGLRFWNEGLPSSALDQLITAAVSGLATGRISAMLAQGINPFTNPADVIIVRGGVSTIGASIGFAAALVWLNRKDLGAIDTMAPPVVAAMAGWHAGCLWRGACLGTQSSLPWAYSLTPEGVTRHPVEIYTALGLVVAAVVVSRLPHHPGLRTGAAILSLSSIRLITEPLRPSITGGPVGWYVFCVVTGVSLMVGANLAVRRSGHVANLSNP